jgi:hypothetical protein
MATATCLWLLLVRLVQRLVQPSSRPSLVESRCSRALLCPDRLVAPGLAQCPILSQGSGGGTHPLGGQPPRPSTVRAAARVSRGRWRREPTTRDGDSAPPSLQPTAAGIPRTASLLETSGARQTNRFSILQCRPQGKAIHRRSVSAHTRSVPSAGDAETVAACGAYAT